MCVSVDLGVGLECGLGARHPASVPRDDLLAGEVRQGDGGPTLLHQGTKVLQRK